MTPVARRGPPATMLARRRMPGIVLGMLVALLAGCGLAAPPTDTPTATGPGESGSGAGDAIAGEIRVFVAASLIDAADELERAFEERHPDVDVLLNVAGSQRLVSQLTEGAEADVFVPADETQMQRVLDAGLASSPATLATNHLEIAVEEGNPTRITGLADLARHDLVVVMASEAVPAGRYARRVLDAAEVMLRPASLEMDVRAALSKVALGEADAAIVYASDVAAHDDVVDGIAIPPGLGITARYPIATLRAAPNPAGADAFTAFARSDAGQQILVDAGFRPAP